MLLWETSWRARLWGSVQDKSTAQRRVISRVLLHLVFLAELYSLFHLPSQASPLHPNASFWHSLNVHPQPPLCGLWKWWRSQRMKYKALCALLYILYFFLSFLKCPKIPPPFPSCKNESRDWIKTQKWIFLSSTEQRQEKPPPMGWPDYLDSP